MGFEIGHILQENKLWTMMVNNLHDVIKHIASSLYIIEAFLITCFAERLTWKTTTQYIMVRNVFLYVNLRYITFYHHIRKVKAIKVLQVFFQFRSKQAPATKRTKCLMKTSQTCK